MAKGVSGHKREPRKSAAADGLFGDGAPAWRDVRNRWQSARGVGLWTKAGVTIAKNNKVEGGHN